MEYVMYDELTKFGTKEFKAAMDKRLMLMDAYNFWSGGSGSYSHSRGGFMGGCGLSKTLGSYWYSKSILTKAIKGIHKYTNVATLKTVGVI